MELIKPKDFLSANKYLKYLGGERFARWLMKVTKLQEFNQRYEPYAHLKGQEFLDGAIKELGFSYEISDEDLKKIPKEGPFITIHNHPYGGLDGILLMRLLPEVRPDFKVLVNFLMSKLDPLEQYLLAVNPFENYKDVKSSLSGLREAFKHLQRGAPLGIYPAGEVATYRFDRKHITDRKWQYSVVKFIKKAQVPVIPVYFDGHNSSMFHLLGFIHPLLRTIQLPKEIFNKEGTVVRIKVGNPIPVKDQDNFSDINQYSRFLRYRTFALSLSLNQKKTEFEADLKGPLVESIKPTVIEEEIGRIRDEYRLFSIENNEVFCVPSPNIPSTIREIGRLREITYREIGEGTGNEIDLDEYDEYYEQLFIWDKENKKIVGGYRVGRGKDILATSGIRGLYISTLFRMGPQMVPVLRETIELGRSFIVKEYQRKTISLFLLWKGILYFLLKNPEYRYLVGPVSISNAFSEFAKTMTVAFMKANYYNYELAEFIRPRKPFKVKIDKVIDKEAFIKDTKNDVGKFDRFVQEVDPGFRTPVLLKKYLSLNAEISGFNVDPKFNNCLDALMILDLLDVPINTIESLSKELDDKSILERFKK